MANKVTPKISSPGSSKFPQKGPHNPNVGTHGSGMAPKPRGGAPIPGNDRPSMPAQAGLARVKNASTGDSGMRLPVQSPKANIASSRVGQAEVAPPGSSARTSPVTKTPVMGNEVATAKPKRKGIGAAFFGEY